MLTTINEPLLKHTIAHHLGRAKIEFKEGKLSYALEKFSSLERLFEQSFSQRNGSSLFQTFNNEIEFIAAGRFLETFPETSLFPERFEQIVWLDIPIAYIYLEMGSSLIEMDKFDDAALALKKAISWNLLSSSSYYEMSYLHQAAYRDYEQSLAYSIKGLTTSYDSEERARGYRHTGSALIDLGKFLHAKASYLKSLILDPSNDLAKSQLQYIEHVAGDLPLEASEEVYDRLLGKVGIPPSVHEAFLHHPSLVQKF